MFDQDFEYVNEDGSEPEQSAEDVELDFEKKFAKGSLYRLCLKSGCLQTPDEEDGDEATLQLVNEINEEFKQWVRRQMGVLLNGTQAPSVGGQFTSEEVSAIKSLVGRFTEQELVALKAWADKLLTKDPAMAIKAVATPVATQVKAAVKPVTASVKASAAPKPQPKPKAKGFSAKEPAKTGEKVAKKGGLRFQKKEVEMPDGSKSATFTPAPREKLKTHIPFPSAAEMEAITFQASQKQIDSHNRNSLENRLPVDSEGNSNITKF